VTFLLTVLFVDLFLLFFLTAMDEV
jgi:hypothetical protein